MVFIVVMTKTRCLGFEKRVEKRTEWTLRGHRVGSDDATSGPVCKGVARRYLRDRHP